MQRISQATMLARTSVGILGRPPDVREDLVEDAGRGLVKEPGTEGKPNTAGNTTLHPPIKSTPEPKSGPSSVITHLLTILTSYFGFSSSPKAYDDPKLQ